MPITISQPGCIAREIYEIHAGIGSTYLTLPASAVYGFVEIAEYKFIESLIGYLCILAKKSTSLLPIDLAISGSLRTQNFTDQNF